MSENKTMTNVLIRDIKTEGHRVAVTEFECLNKQMMREKIGSNKS